MKQLNKPSDNMGGLLRIWAVPLSVITVSGNSVSISSTLDVIAIYATPGTMGFSEKETIGREGISYDTELVAKTPKDSSAARDVLDLLAGRRWVVVYMDQNEQYKLVGTPDNPLRATVDLDTGSDTAAYNGYLISFKGKQQFRSRFIDDPWVE